VLTAAFELLLQEKSPSAVSLTTKKTAYAKYKLGFLTVFCGHGIGAAESTGKDLFDKL